MCDDKGYGRRERGIYDSPLPSRTLLVRVPDRLPVVTHPVSKVDRRGPPDKNFRQEKRSFGIIKPLTGRKLGPTSQKK